MKTKIIAGLALVMGLSAVAQENDDMYFRSKDREKLQKVSKDSYSSNYENFKKKHFDEATELDEYAVNPTDSYSSRNINPEYIARSSSELASEDESNYFVENYNAPVQSYTGNNSNFYNNNYNNSWNNQWNNPYARGYYGSPYNSSLYSPYYGWNDPWANPYWWGNNYNSGWSFGSSIYWGNSWNAGCSYGIGYTWGNPYRNLWGPSYYNSYYRPYTTVIVVGEGSLPNYGKRPSHNSIGVSDVTNRYNRTSTSVNNGDTRGRVSSRTTDEYYVRPSRRTYTDSNTSSDYSRSTNSSNTYRSLNNSNSTNRDSRSSGFSTPTRSSSGSSMSAPSRSSGSSSGGSSSGSRRQGGN